MSYFADQATLGAARQWLREQLTDGAACPCCNQHAQIYRWSLYSTAMRALALYERLGRDTPDGFVHTTALKEAGHKGQGDASRLQHWGLVERETAAREDGGRSGFWRVADKGRRFLAGDLALPKYAYVYDGRVLNFAGPSITATDVGGPFRFDDVVRSA